MNKITINKINLVSMWNYNLPSNNDCTICRCNLNDNSLYNQEKGKDSNIVQGLCNHSFHEECINPWIMKNNHCPICSIRWKSIKIYSSN